MKKRIELDLENRLEPLTDALRQQLCACGTGPVSDACPEAVTLGGNLYPIDNYPCVAGRAFPVDAGPGDNLTAWASLKFVQPGDLLFVSTHSYTKTSVCGDLLIGFAKNAGTAAVITDGYIRDLNGIRETKLPVFAAGTSPRAPLKKGPGKIGHPISLAGAKIERDMVVVCDRDGIVAFDPKHLQSTLEKLEAIKAKESKASQEIADGRKLPSWIEPMLDDIDFV